MRNEMFGRLLKGAISSISHYEGKTAPFIEEDLGQQIGLQPASIQRYKAGHLPPEVRTIEILAEAAMKRGYLNREWLQAFLRAAHHPAPEKLLDRLCPLGPARPRPPRPYHNLPAPTYSQFVMRAQVFAEVVEGLSKRSAAVLIVGFSGNGKTSLAREVAARCLQDDGDVPRFDAVVWVSDKDRPATTNLSMVLDEIARTLDYPGYTQFEHEEKRREVEQLLRRQRVLVVIDNFETITDGLLLSWLLNLPEPSKALITTREYRREFRRGGWPVDLRGMTEAEARELIAERVHVLKIEKLVGDLTQLEPLLVATRGNPKAIELTLGLVKYERQPLQQVVDDLYAARGELFDDLFTRAWGLLDVAARRVLLITTFFPTSASSAALSATADIQGFTFDRCIERLTDLALLEVQQEGLNCSPRYALHPLVRAFARARRAEELEFEAAARRRWVEWYVQLVDGVGYCWDDLHRLELLDPEQETIYTVLMWTFQNQQYTATLQLVKGSSYYYYIRGLWDKSPSLNLTGAAAAHHLDQTVDEVEMLTYHVQMLSIQGSLAEAMQYLSKLRTLAQSTPLPDDVFLTYQHAIAMYWLTCGDLDAAEQAWQESLKRTEQLATPTRDVNRRWLATCLYLQGKLEEAQQIFQEALADAVQAGYMRGVMFCKVRLAAIYLDRGEVAQAAAELAETSTLSRQYDVRGGISDAQRLYARLYALRGDLSAACVALAEAIDLYERLGRRRELTEAREELARLETTIAAGSEPAQV